MKRFLSLLNAVTALLLVMRPSYAEGYSDEVPAIVPSVAIEELDGASVVLMDIDSRSVVYESNGDLMSKPGSLTVLMTSLLLIENTPAEEWDTPLSALTSVNSRWSGRGSQLGLSKGDEPTRRDLLYAMLLIGAADAAYVTELAVSGSEAAFVDAMNARAEELGLSSTHFENGYGLGGGNHYTCAYDMALLTAEAMKSEIFAEAVSSVEFTCSAGCGRKHIRNSNSALGKEHCIGVKLGSDSEREHCLVAAAEVGSLRLAAVVLDAVSDNAAFSAASKLLNSGFAAYYEECGYCSYSPTDALFSAKNDASVKDYTEEETGVIEKGGVVRVCGSGLDMNGTPVYYIERDGEIRHVSAADLDFVCYVNDVFVYNGLGLSRELKKGDYLDCDGYALSRHEIVSIDLTIRDRDGKDVLRASRTPRSHGKVEIGGKLIEAKLGGFLISEGIYECAVTVMVKASAMGCPDETLKKESVSTFSVGSGGECVNYNSNRGENGPRGECFYGGFTVTDTEPTRAGYTFEGWCEDPTGRKELLKAGEMVYSAEPVTLYAVWKRGFDKWETALDVSYEAGLILEGEARNNAGITSIGLSIEHGGETVFDETVKTSGNSIVPGELFTDIPLLTQKGSYTVRITGSAAGKPEELLLEKTIELSKEEAKETPVPSETAAPTEAPEDEGPRGLASIPIAVWYGVGTVVVIILLAIIISILKKG